MSERETPNQVKNSGDDVDDEMRPLPDGGLGAAMPDWLRKPPAWRNLSRPEAVPESAAKDLPEPDTSVIDPRTLVDIDDLPAWLQDIAARSTDEDPEAGASADTVAATEPETPVKAPPPEPAAAPPATTVELTTDETAQATPARSTPAWIWVMRGAIILSLLLVIYYVFFL